MGSNKCDTNIKVPKFRNLYGNIRRSLPGNDQMESLLKLYNVTVILVLCYGHGCRTSD